MGGVGGRRRRVSKKEKVDGWVGLKNDVYSVHGVCSVSSFKTRSFQDDEETERGRGY